jgi:hypothetical protein
MPELAGWFQWRFHDNLKVNAAFRIVNGKAGALRRSSSFIFVAATPRRFNGRGNPAAMPALSIHSWDEERR